MRAVFFLFFSILSFFAAGQSDDRVKLRDLQAATGDGQVIQSINDTSRWVVPPWADSISVLQDSIVVLYSDGSEVARDTVGPFGGATTVYYQTLRDDGTPLTQRDAINFVATSTVATTLTDDAGNGETEVAMSVPTGGITSTQILDGTITTTDLAFTVNSGSGVANQVTYWSGTNTLAGDADLTFDGTNITSAGMISGQTGEIQTDGSYCANPSGGVVALGTGAIEIKLPSPQFGGGGSFRQWRISFDVTLEQGSASGANTKFLVNIYGFNSPGVSGSTNVFSVSNSTYTNINWRVGHDGTNIIVWIGELATAWGTGKAMVTNVRYGHVSGTQPTLTELCSGWVLSIEASAFNTVTRSGRILPDAALILSAADHEPTGELWSTPNVLSFKYQGGFTGAHEITYAGTLPASGRYRITCGVTTASVGNMYEFDIVGNINGAAWTGVEVLWKNGPPTDARLSVRVGDATTTLKIWIGELTSVWFGAAVAVKDVDVWAISTDYSGSFLDMVLPSNWSISTEATAFNNVDATVAYLSQNSIPYASSNGYTHSSNFSYNGSNLAVGISSATSSLHLKSGGATAVTSGFLYENSSGTDIIFGQDDGKIGVMTNLPARTFHVAGEARITDLTTDTPTRIVGADADGDLNEITVSSELLLSGGVLSVGTLSHAALSDLGSPEDDHDQYLNIFGRAGGQIVYGATGASENLDLNSTTNATKGNILLQDEGGNVIIGGAATSSRLRMMEASGSGTNYTEFVTQAQAANIAYTLPADDGDAGEQLQTNGSGTLSWEPTGKAPDVQIYAFSGTDTYVIPTGVRTVEIICIGAGGGGGSGRRGATTEANTGGGGGGGGAYTAATFAVSELSSTTLNLTIGAGGNNGAARSTDNTNGADGTAGGATYVECSGYLIIYAGGGEYGTGGTVAASTGGTGSGIGDFDGVDGAGCPDTGSPSAPMAANKKSGAGGGAGGGIPTGGTPAQNGGATGKWNYGQEAANAGGTAPGGNGSDADALNAQHFIGGNGGSGGASSITGAAGAGGDGLQGGGGGGGGASLNATGNSGAGGDGGDGYIMIIAKY